tara:strand:- start:13411 stop:14175 length:765 start_codon:yes stop_codon:yes gene_type:complete
MQTLKAKRILVTGAGAGIGRSIAVKAAQLGCRVAVADIDKFTAEMVAQEINSAGGEAITIEVDVSSMDSVAAMITRCEATFGGLDCAVNNAGVASAQALIEESCVDDWHRIMDINLTGCYLCMKHQIPLLRAAGGGTIVNMSSMAGVLGAPMLAAYSASKHGILGLTKTAAAEYGGANIRVNAVCPGVVNTETIRNSGVDWALHNPNPLGRTAEPEEIAEVVLWLLSSASSYINGQGICVDGGRGATNIVMPSL